jgi:hypothetical protein
MVLKNRVNLQILGSFLFGSILTYAADIGWVTLQAKKFSDIRISDGSNHITEVAVDFSGPQVVELFKILPPLTWSANEDSDDGYSIDRHRKLEVTNVGRPGVTLDSAMHFSIFCSNQEFDEISKRFRDNKDGPKCKVFITKGTAG